MKCQGVFVFKSIQSKEGGTFTNQQGQPITYKPSYEIKFDDIVDNVPTERKIKIPEEELDLIDKIKKLKPYTRNLFTFDVSFNSKGTSLKLLDITSAKDNSDKE